MSCTHIESQGGATNGPLISTAAMRPSRKYVPFHQYAYGVSHEFAGHLQDVVGQCGRQQDDLCGRGQVAVHVVDLLFETYNNTLVTYG